MHCANLIQRIVTDITERHAWLLDNEAKKPATWADNLHESLSTELKDLENQIKDGKRVVRLSGTLHEKNILRRDLSRLESGRAAKAYELFQKEVEIRAKRDALYEAIEAKLTQTQQEQSLFTIQWSVT